MPIRRRQEFVKALEQQLEYERKVVSDKR